MRLGLACVAVATAIFATTPAAADEIFLSCRMESDAEPRVMSFDTSHETIQVQDSDTGQFWDLCIERPDEVNVCMIDEGGLFILMEDGDGNLVGTTHIDRATGRVEAYDDRANLIDNGICERIADPRSHVPDRAF